LMPKNFAANLTLKAYRFNGSEFYRYYNFSVVEGKMGNFKISKRRLVYIPKTDVYVIVDLEIGRYS